MEHSEKMVMIPLDESNIKDKYEDFLKIALKLAKNNAYNENLQLKVNNEYKKVTNIIEYILNTDKKELKYMKDYESYLNLNKLYTKVSPVDIKSNKNKKFPWIKV